MTTKHIDTDALGGDLLAEVTQQISAAEQRREQQIHIVDGFPEGTEGRAFAKHELFEIEKTLTLSRAQHALIKNLLR